MIRVCKHLFWTNFLTLSPCSKVLWLFAASNADSEGIVQINIAVLPKLAGLTDEQGEQAIEELGKHNFYDDDSAPFLSRYETENWNITRIQPWNCRTCETTARRFISFSIREDVLAVGFCAHCGSTENLEVDHIRPVSRGGDNERGNLQALCATCNRSKRNRFIG